MKLELGTLTRVQVKHYWKNEQIEFTPWLAEESNMAHLAEAVGLELEVEGTEVPVGPYSADILAKDTATDQYVVIENQFGKTNHDHLGKVLTYAAVLDAGTIIWVAEQFSEEHRKALEWLNDHTDGKLAFYGVSLELWKINESPPALRFNVVSQPGIVVPPPHGITGAKKIQLEFWTEFGCRLEQAKVVKKAHSPRPQYWFNVSLGRSGVHLSHFASTAQNRIGVRVYMRKKISAIAFSRHRQDPARSLGKRHR
jgi:hypothetical protein